jgi:hypothetical protein
MSLRPTHLLAFAPLLALVVGCGSDDSPSASSSAASTGASSASGSGGGGGSSTSTSTSTASGGGGSGTGGSSGVGGSGGFPWDGYIDPEGGPSSTRLVERQLGTTTAPQGFLEYVPAGYPSKVKWPLLIAEHGVGENGNGTDQLKNVANTGVPAIMKYDKWPDDRPFVVLMPQHPGGGCPGADEIQAFIAWGMANYEIDPRFVYLTGLSCGAIGSWTYVDKYLDAQVAAFVPIAGDGVGAWNNRGCELGKLAIWGFHGDADSVVGVNGTNVPLDGLMACPHPPALESKKTIYPNVGHDSWDMTYDLSAGNDVFTWMLGFQHP